MAIIVLQLKEVTVGGPEAGLCTGDVMYIKYYIQKARASGIIESRAGSQ